MFSEKIFERFLQGLKLGFRIANPEYPHVVFFKTMASAEGSQQRP